MNPSVFLIRNFCGRNFNSYHSTFLFTRKGSSYARVMANLDENVHSDIENNKMKARRHPGIFRQKFIKLPTELKTAIKKVIRDTPLKQLLVESKHFHAFLLGRKINTERSDYLRKLSSAREEVKENLGAEITIMGEQELKTFSELVNTQAKQLVKKNVYNWTKLDFTRHMGLIYLIGRGVAEYAVLCQIFKEIFKRTNFKPKRIFDFGSGIGTVLWAADDVWNESIKEYYCVDSSRNMIELSEEIISESRNDLMKKIFYRQFIPSSTINAYDVVVSAYTLLELPSELSRLEVISKLWNKTRKFLVLVEPGTKAGFQVLNKARNYLLSATYNKDEERRFAHLFAPCPHEFSCPLASMEEKCTFEAAYFSYPGPETTRRESYSYMVFVKGERQPGDPQWPRIVKPVLNRSRHSICRFCVNSGGLQEIIFSPAKHGTIAYKCAKSSQQGDLFPCNIKYITKSEGNTSEEAPT